MEMTPFKVDIKELVEDFEKGEALSFAQYKDIWRDHKFSFIHEAGLRPKDSAFFMQTLYDTAISYMRSEGTLSRRLAGLYTLYCLYETQLFSPSFKIYLSLKDLDSLTALVVDSKHNHIMDSLAVIKKMLEKNMFLFGFVEVDEELVSRTFSEIAEKQHAHLRVASEKLLSGTNIQQHIQLNLAKELKLDELSRQAKEYSSAKDNVMKELEDLKNKRRVLDVPEINTKEVGEELRNISEAWNEKCKIFSDHTGLQKNDQEAEDDEFAEELDALLLENS